MITKTEFSSIKTNKENILILETELLLHPSVLKTIQKDIVKQLKEGVVVIPSGFSCKIINAAPEMQEETQWTD